MERAPPRIECGTCEELAAEIRRRDDRLGALTGQLQEANRRLRQANRALRRLAATDPLTGVGNRRELDERLQLELKRCGRSGEPLSLLFLDVDHFKEYNDRLGHQAGDEVLARMGILLRHAVRTSDTVARFGGEEFVVLLPDTSEDGALILAEKLREAVAGRLEADEPITASIGAATCRPPAGRGIDFRMEARRLLAAADRAVYRAKASGRDCVVQEPLE